MSSSRNPGVFDNDSSPSNEAGSLLSRAWIGADSYKTIFRPYDTLRKTFEALQEIKALLDGLSEQRRRKIAIAAQSGACHSLESLELELDRCVPPNPDCCLALNTR